MAEAGDGGSNDDREVSRYSKLRKIDLIVDKPVQHEVKKKTGKQLPRHPDIPWDRNAEPGEHGDHLIPLGATDGACRLRERVHGVESNTLLRQQEALEFRKLAPALQDITIGQVKGGRETIYCREGRIWWGPALLEYCHLTDEEDKTLWKVRTCSRFYASFPDYNPDNRVFNTSDGPVEYERKVHATISTRAQAFQRKITKIGNPMQFRPNPTLDRLIAGENRYRTCWETWHKETKDPKVYELYEAAKKEYHKLFPNGDMPSNCVHLKQKAKLDVFNERAQEAEEGGDPDFRKRWEEKAREIEPITEEQRFDFRESAVHSASHVGGQVSRLADVVVIQVFIADFGRGSSQVKVIQHGGAGSPLVSDDPESSWAKNILPAVNSYAASALKIKPEDVTLGAAHENLIPPEKPHVPEAVEKQAPEVDALVTLDVNVKSRKAKEVALTKFFKENFAIVRGFNKVPWHFITLKPTEYIRGAPQVEEKLMYEGKQIVVSRSIPLRVPEKMSDEEIKAWHGYLRRCQLGQEPQENTFAFVGVKQKTSYVLAPASADGQPDNSNNDADEPDNSGAAGPSTQDKGKAKASGRGTSRSKNGAKRGSTKRKGAEEDFEMIDVDIASDEDTESSSTDEDTVDSKAILIRRSTRQRLRGTLSLGGPHELDDDSDPEDEFGSARKQKRADREVEMHVPRSHCVQKAKNASTLSSTLRRWVQRLDWTPVVHKCKYTPVAVPTAGEALLLVGHDEIMTWDDLLQGAEVDFSIHLADSDLPTVVPPLRTQLQSLIDIINDPNRPLPVRIDFETILKQNLSQVVAWLFSRLQTFLSGPLNDPETLLTSEFSGAKGMILILRLFNLLHPHASALGIRVFERAAEDCAEKLVLTVALRRSVGLGMLQSEGFGDNSDGQHYVKESGESQRTFIRFMVAWHKTISTMLNVIFSTPAGGPRSFYLWGTSTSVRPSTNPFESYFRPSGVFAQQFTKTWRVKAVEKRHQIVEQQDYLREVTVFPLDTLEVEPTSLWRLLNLGVSTVLVGIWFVSRGGKGCKNWADLVSGLVTKLDLLERGSRGDGPSDGTNDEDEERDEGGGENLKANPKVVDTDLASANAKSLLQPGPLPKKSPLKPIPSPKSSPLRPAPSPKSSPRRPALSPKKSPLKPIPSSATSHEPLPSDDGDSGASENRKEQSSGGPDNPALPGGSAVSNKPPHPNASTDSSGNSEGREEEPTVNATEQGKDVGSGDPGSNPSASGLKTRVEGMVKRRGRALTQGPVRKSTRNAPAVEPTPSEAEDPSQPKTRSGKKRQAEAGAHNAQGKTSSGAKRKKVA